ncbi:MAG: transposase [Planctomycetota bacterium]
MSTKLPIDGAVHADVFEAFVEQVRVPTLRRGGVVVMDHRRSHKRARTRQRIRGVGARWLLLPPYSPDLNPIEMAFAKIKQRLRSRACRTRDTGWSAMPSVLDEATASDARHGMRHGGYTLQAG